MSIDTGGLRCFRFRPRWWCPRCGDSSRHNGHRCLVCRRIVCCSACFDHLDACCRDFCVAQAPTTGKATE